MDISLDNIQKTMVDTLGKLLSPEACRRMNREISFSLAQMTADHLATASVDRHRTADRLGADHTGFLEFAPGRVDSTSKTGGKLETAHTEDEAIVRIENTPGLQRAYGPLHIVAKRKALTIPINRISYARRASELRSEGWDLFRVSTRGGGPGHGILFGRRGGDTRALYLLRHSVTIPQDSGLLPTDDDYRLAAEDAASQFIEMEAS